MRQFQLPPPSLIFTLDPHQSGSLKLSQSRVTPKKYHRHSFVKSYRASSTHSFHTNLCIQLLKIQNATPATAVSENDKKADKKDTIRYVNKILNVELFLCQSTVIIYPVQDA